MRKKISVAIISYNTKDLLRACIESVLRNIDIPNEKIWVVDNSSSDGSKEMVLKEFKEEVELLVNSTNKGFSYACNKGLKETDGDYILFLNGDVVLPDGTLTAMKNMMDQHSDIGILSPKLVGPNEKIIQMSWGWNLTLLGEMRQKMFSPRYVSKFALIRKFVEKFQKKGRDVPIVAGACMMVRRELIENIKGFDEKFELYFEDADLCVRCRKAGFRVRFTPEIKVRHSLGQSGKNQAKKIVLVYRQSQIYFYKKHNSSIESLFLKIYLWWKFLTSSAYWLDSNFRYWINQILREKKKFTLSSSREFS